MKLKISDTELGSHLLVAKQGPKYLIFLNSWDDNNLTYHRGLFLGLNKIFHLIGLKDT